MSASAANELWAVFDARRVKAPELKGLDSVANGAVGWVKNRRRMLARYKQQVERIEAMEKEIHELGATRFAEEVQKCRDLARRNRLEGHDLERGLALVREGALRAVGMRPFKVQLMGALAMIDGNIAEMATGEGKTLTASLAASVWAWHGRPVHVLTVNDYLVERDAHEMGPVYKQLGLRVGAVTHETAQDERIDHYRRDVVYITSKELVADFLRDQIALGTLRNAAQTSVQMLLRGSSAAAGRLMVPGLFRALVDEADSLLIDEAVTPLIISNSPDEDPNETYYRAAAELGQQLEPNKDFVIDWTVRSVDLTQRGQDKLDHICEQQGTSGFWQGRRRREELVTLAVTANHCYVRDEQYLIAEDGTVQIIDEFTGRVMADRSWRHGLHQAIEIKEQQKVTADKENLARLSFQRFFRQYPHMAGMTGTVWEAAGEMWQIYARAIVRIPTNKPCIRTHLPVRMFDTMEQKWTAVVKRTLALHEKGVPVLIGTRSVLASEEVSKRLTAAGTPHQVLNANQTAQEAFIVAQAGQRGQITVATNMAGRGTDIKLARGVADIGGLHVISTEPHGSGRVDRQLFGRAARQGDPGSAQMFCSKEDDLFIRHAKTLRHTWRGIGAKRLIKLAQANAERLARFNRKQVLKQDDWMDESLPF
ncbi:MAG: secA [Phycisphaerales bacterium]|nr:secA [Phycisphaerales bacterium]